MRLRLLRLVGIKSGITSDPPISPLSHSFPPF
nr:MAG TPA: hypothetical protein [Caudoviricetes sp.]